MYSSDLREKELAAKVFMEEYFIPVMHEIFVSASPEAYKIYGGNACRQTAVFGVGFLEQMLPEFSWSAWEAEFTDTYRGQRINYEHAWIYGVDEYTKRRLLVDLSRNKDESLFLVVDRNSHPKSHPKCANMVEVSRKRIDIEERMKEDEFYTSLPSRRLAEDIKIGVLMRMLGNKDEMEKTVEREGQKWRLKKENK